MKNIAVKVNLELESKLEVADDSDKLRIIFSSVITQNTHSTAYS
jgi:hypothetical protein